MTQVPLVHLGNEPLKPEPAMPQPKTTDDLGELYGVSFSPTSGVRREHRQMVEISCHVGKVFVDAVAKLANALALALGAPDRDDPAVKETCDFGYASSVTRQTPPSTDEAHTVLGPDGSKKLYK